MGRLLKDKFNAVLFCFRGFKLACWFIVSCDGVLVSSGACYFVVWLGVVANGVLC